MTDLSNQIFPHPVEPTPSLPEQPEELTLDSLILGELNAEQRVEVVESITNLTVTLQAQGISTLNFTVYDPGFRMHDNNYFLIRRVVEFNGMLYEIVSVSLTHDARDTVQVVARNMKMQKMRRDFGNFSWGQISPTDLARIAAKKFGLGFVGQQSNIKGTISRVYNAKTKESTYDVLKKLARELEFMFFEAKDYLFFASEDFIVDIQGQVRLFIPGRDSEIDPVTGGYVTDIIFPLKSSLARDGDAKKKSTFTCQAYRNATSQQLYPGLGASFKKVVERYQDNELITRYEEPFPNFEDLYFIDKVNYSMVPNSPISFSGTSIKDTADMLCSTKVFQAGSTGPCVERIQYAVGMTGASVTGVFDKATVTAVTNFQRANILKYSDLPQFSGDNWKDIMNLGVVGEVTWEWIKAVNLSEVTVPIPVIRAQDADDEIAARGFDD